jgi:hypothetical protein
MIGGLSVSVIGGLSVSMTGGLSVIEPVQETVDLFFGNQEFVLDRNDKIHEEFASEVMFHFLNSIETDQVLSA